MTDIDWKRLGQVVWVQDFPQRASSNKFVTSFATELREFLEALPVSAKMLDDFDFSSAKVELITSIPGFHKNTRLDKYGHMRRV